jgi:tetratricopeptide (TPR) repeat protein
VLKRIAPDLHGYGYFLGKHAFGLEECGEYKVAERTGLAAVEYHSGDLWAVHAVAHVYEMQCRIKEGLDWISRLSPSWRGRGNFVYHLWWHRALLLFELEQWNAVLELYDREIRADKTEFAADLQNAASLLWRLELRGVDVGHRWQELAQVSSKRLVDMAHPFNSLHFVMALLRAGRVAEARQHMEAMRRHVEARRPRPKAPKGTSPSSAAARTQPLVLSDTLAPVFEDVAIPASEGLAAFHEGVFSQATERLMKSFGKLQSIGGSHAQRDVIVLTMIQAARDGGYLALARDLLAARTHTKEGSADAWHAYGRVLELSRDIGDATVARARGDSIVHRSQGTV